MLTKIPVTVLALLLSLPLLAEPFVLAETGLGASRWAPNGIRIGASPHGFLLGGTVSHHPVVIPLGPHSGPLIEGSLSITESDAWTRGGISNASSVGEPIWTGDRWVMLLSPDHLLPDHVAIAEVAADGTRLGEPNVLPWTRFRGGELAWNGRTFLAVAAVDRTTTILRDLSVRVISEDLESAGEEHFLALDIHGFEIVGTDEGFVVSWSGSSGNWLQRLDDAGQPIGDAVAVSGRPGLTTNGRETLVTWWEELGTDRVLWSMVLDENGVLTPPATVATLSDTERAACAVEWAGDAFLLAWQPITYEGQYFGGEISVRRLDASGAPIDEPWLLPGLVGGEVIAGSAARGEQMLLAYTRHIPGVGEPVWSTVIQGREASTQRLVSVTEATPQNLELSSAEDGTIWGAWVETTGTGSLLNVGRWNLDGERISLATVADIPGRFGGIDIESSGAGTMLVWQQGYAIFGAPLTDSGTFAAEPFYVAIGDGWATAPTSPRMEWDGERFVVVWLGEGGVHGAHVVPQGVQRQLGVLAVAPPDRDDRSYSIGAIELALAGTTIAISSTITETVFCVQPVCSSRQYAGWIVSHGGSLETFELHPMRSDPTVSSNGESFLMSWVDQDGIQVMPLDIEGRAGTETLVFRWPGPGAPVLTPTGETFVLAFAYTTSAWGRIGVLNVDANGQVLGPARGLETADRYPTAQLRAQSAGGDVLIGWGGRTTRASNKLSLLGQFVRDAELNPPPPPRPTGAQVTPIQPWNVLLTWNPVPGADEYQIEQRYFDEVFQRVRWAQVARTSATSIQTTPPPLRILALGKGGASAPLEVGVETPRRRGVSRP